MQSLELSSTRRFNSSLARSAASADREAVTSMAIPVSRSGLPLPAR